MKKRWTGILIFVAVIALGCGIWITQAKFKQQDITIYAMDTVMTLSVYGKCDEGALAKAENRIREIESTFSVTDKNSEVYKINHRTVDEIKISGQFMELLELGMEYGTRGEGAFDITMYPVTSLWGFTGESYQVPEKEMIADALNKVGVERLTVNQEKGLLSLDSGMELDFGAMAKGYAAQEIKNVLQEKGVQSAIINLGGNVQTIGVKPDGSRWKVAIKNPFAPQEYLGAVAVGEKAVVTSGGYERYFEDAAGNIWWHIMDPTTGYPAQKGLESVTIVSDDGVLSDVLSTMLFVKGLDDAIKDWKEHQDYEAVLVTDEKEIYVTEGIYEDFVLINKGMSVHKIERE